MNWMLFFYRRQLLDDDQKDVRMLKEMLFEDGDLHSDGKRQRKFQWTNLGELSPSSNLPVY